MYHLWKFIQNWYKSRDEDTEFSETEDDKFMEPSGIEECTEGKHNICVSQSDVQEFRSDHPEYVLTASNHIEGVIVDISADQLVISHDSSSIKVNSSCVDIEEVHEIGDRVYVLIQRELEELFSGDIEETLHPVAIVPSSKRKNQKCVLDKLENDYAALSNNCYINKSLLDQMQSDTKFHIGDVLQVDMIACVKDAFKWRCIRCCRIENTKNLQHQPKPPATAMMDPPVPLKNWANYNSKLCEYANQVLMREVGTFVPGETSNPKRRFKHLRIPHYEMPHDIPAIYLSKYYQPQQSRQDIETAYPCLLEELNYQNYVRRFQVLLWLEEAELFKSYRSYDCKRVQFTRDTGCLAMVVKDLAERRPSLVIGDKVHAYCADERSDIAATAPHCYEGIIQSVLCDKVLLKFNTAFQDRYDGGSYRVEFFFSRINFRRKHFAVLRATETLGNNFLFPQDLHLRERPQMDVRLDEDTGILHTNDDTIKWHNSNLNQFQRFAVYKIMRGEVENLPYVIFGPPGTGKTITLIETILQLVSNLPHAKLLVGTPSNSGANLICSRLIESKGLHVGELVRLISFNQIERDQVPEQLLSYCATVDPGEEGTYPENQTTTSSGIQMNCPLRMMARYRVTVSTCANLGRYLELGFNKDHFTHVLIDEAAQCTEPEVMIALSLVSKKCGQVILAGDPMQLRPVIANKYADSRGLSNSFLERLMETKLYRKDVFSFAKRNGYNPLLVTKLLLSYRALPSILRIYNYLFYDLELKATIDSEASRELKILEKLQKTVLFSSAKRKISHGAFFFEVRGENLREADSPSWCNPREANVVFNTTLALYRLGFTPDDIGIITPYIKQVRYIRNIFTTSKLKSPKIGSVEEFQGQERDIILLSTVRTSSRQFVNYDTRYSLGFISAERRFNVAISRARALLIVFGDSRLLTTDECWGVYLTECRNNDSYYG